MTDNEQDTFFQEPEIITPSMEELLAENRTLRVHIEELRQRYHRAKHASSMEVRELQRTCKALQAQIESMNRKCEAEFEGNRCQQRWGHDGNHRHRLAVGPLAGCHIEWPQTSSLPVSWTDPDEDPYAEDED